MTLKIRHKLFFAILIANIILAISIYFLSNWSFSKSFKDYLDSAQAERLAPMVSAVAETYQQEQNWDWVKSRYNHTWPQLLQQHVHKRPPRGSFRPPPPSHQPPPHRPPPPPNAHNGDHRNENWQRPGFEKPSHRPGFDRPPFRPPPPRSSDPLAINSAILLADKDHQLIIGRPDKQQTAYWIPVTVNGSNVGYLGFFRTTKFTSELDQLFIKRLQTNFSWIVLGMIFVSLLITLPFARQIVKPIEKLRRATNKITSGHYETQIKINSHDEIGELSRDFNLLAKTLAKNLQARQQWIADISHELRTPVAVLQGEVEAMQDGIRTLSESSINSLHQEIIRLSRLINDLHQLSLSDLGALSYKKETLNLLDIIEEVLDSKSDLLNEKNIQLQFLHSKKNISISGDYHRLTQLFYNLLNNSLSYTADTGSITIATTVANKQVTISWEDSEPGVSDNDLTQLFERLYRAEASRNRNTGGSGLGLSISKNIVEAHNGTITASHSTSGGVCFTIILPLITNI